MATKKKSTKNPAAKKTTVIKIAETIGTVAGEIAVKKDQFVNMASGAIDTVKSKLRDLTAPKKSAKPVVKKVKKAVAKKVTTVKKAVKKAEKKVVKPAVKKVAKAVSKKAVAAKKVVKKEVKKAVKKAKGRK